MARPAGTSALAATSGDLRRELARSLAGPVGSLAAIGLAVAAIPLRSQLPRPGLLLPFAVLVAVVTVTGGRSAGAGCAVVGALAHDSFLVPPFPDLQLDARPFWMSLVALVGVALLGARRQHREAR